MIMVIGLTQRLYASLVDDPRILEEAYALFLNDYREILFKTTRPYRDRSIIRDLASQILNRVMQRLELKIGQSISRHSTLFWLQLVRRLPSEFWLDHGKLPSTALYGRLTLDLAIVKYGNDRIRDIARSYDRTLVPKFNRNDLVLLRYLRDLCSQFYAETAAYRVVNKGAKFKISESGFYECVAMEPLRRMMDLYDRRSEDYGNLFASFGHVYEQDITAPENLARVDWLWIIYATPCFGAPLFASHGLGALSSKVPSELVQFWDKMNITVRGFRVSDLVACLVALTCSRWAFDRPHAESMAQLMFRDLTSKGYSSVHTGVVESDMTYVLPSVFKEMGSETLGSSTLDPAGRARKFVNRFVNTYSDRKRVNLQTRRNAPIFIRWVGGTLIDWTKTESFIREWLDELGEAQFAQVATNRGQLFQEELRRYIQAACKEIMFWPSLSSLIYKRSRKVGEIDTGCFRGEVFYLIECKVKLLNSEYVPGHHKKESYLWSQCTKWLKQVDKTAAELSSGALLKDGSALPAKIKYIIPIVCAPTVEGVNSFV